MQYGVRRLAYYEEYDSFEVARLREIQIKDRSQKKKRKLISGEWNQAREKDGSRRDPL